MPQYLINKIVRHHISLQQWEATWMRYSSIKIFFCFCLQSLLKYLLWLNINPHVTTNKTFSIFYFLFIKATMLLAILQFRSHLLLIRLHVGVTFEYYAKYFKLYFLHMSVKTRPNVVIFVIRISYFFQSS